MTERPEYYERSPDGAQWPGTLAGLLQAMDDSVLESCRVHDQQFTLSAIHEGHAVPFHSYRNGTGAAQHG